MVLSCSVQKCDIPKPDTTCARSAKDCINESLPAKNRKTEEPMGKISRDLDVEISRVAALLNAHIPMQVPGNGLSVGPHGGPVVGMAIVSTSHLNGQMDAIYRCLKEIGDAIKQLDEQLNPNT